jgi:hypothetical protein
VSKFVNHTLRVPHTFHASSFTVARPFHIQLKVLALGHCTRDIAFIHTCWHWHFSSVMSSQEFIDVKHETFGIEAMERNTLRHCRHASKTERSQAQAFGRSLALASRLNPSHETIKSITDRCPASREPAKPKASRHFGSSHLCLNQIPGIT